MVTPHERRATPQSARKAASRRVSPERPEKSIECVTCGDYFSWPSARRAGPACVVAPRISRAQLCTQKGRKRLRPTIVEPGRCG